jgi:L-asparagine transporter-like permease
MAMIAMGSALGTGLFLGSGQAIGYAGPGVIIAFALGSLIAASIALAMGEMASRHPVSGGFGTLAARYLSPFWGYLSRWMYWIVTVGVTGTELVACASYLSYWFPAIPMGVGIVVFAAVILLVNVTTVGSFGIVEFFLSSIKVFAIFAFILVGIVLVFFGLPDTPAAGVSLLTADGGFLPTGWNGVWLALSVVMFSFGGIELLSITAAEAKDPARSIRSAARTTMVRLALFYVACITIVVCLVPWRQASSTGEEVATSPFVLVFDAVGIPAAAHLTNLLVLVAALSAANANLYAGSRMLHSLSLDRMAPRFLSRLSVRRVPVRGIAVSSVGIVVAAVLAFSGIGARWSGDGGPGTDRDRCDPGDDRRPPGDADGGTGRRPRVGAGHPHLLPGGTAATGPLPQRRGLPRGREDPPRSAVRSGGRYREWRWSCRPMSTWVGACPRLCWLLLRRW